jgi:hypothetical protein
MHRWVFVAKHLCQVQTILVFWQFFEQRQVAKHMLKNNNGCIGAKLYTFIGLKK